MTEQEKLQAEDDEISLIDLLLFLKASGGKILKSTCVCLLAGGVYYFSAPKMYEASATIEMATVAGEPVETPAVLLEKMKLPLYFSPATLQACGSDGGLSSQAKFVDKIKPTTSKSALMVSFVTQAPSTQEAKACLNEAIAEVSSKQEAITNPLRVLIKQKIQQLSEELKIAEEIRKSLPSPKFNNNLTDTQSRASILLEIFRKKNVIEINDLRSQISSLKLELIEPRTRPLTSWVYSSDVSVHNLPLFTLGICLVALGVFLGLLITVVMQKVPEIMRKMREAQANRVQISKK